MGAGNTLSGEKVLAGSKVEIVFEQITGADLALDAEAIAIAFTGATITGANAACTKTGVTAVPAQNTPTAKIFATLNVTDTSTLQSKLSSNAIYVQEDDGSFTKVAATDEYDAGATYVAWNNTDEYVPAVIEGKGQITVTFTMPAERVAFTEIAFTWPA